MATPIQVKEYFEKLGPIVSKVCTELGYGNAQIWTCLAQGACESAYGTSSLMRKANALFGIKASKTWTGKRYNSKTKECYDGSNYVSIRDYFRAYDNVEGSVRDYFKLIQGNRYKESLTKTTVNDCITCIKNGGYATSPTYINTINTIYNSHRDAIEMYKVVTECPQKQSIDSIAKEVISGIWGSGSDRRKRLEAANLNYAEVQNRVNEMLKVSARKSNEEIAQAVIRGEYGNGTVRKNRITEEGYDYETIRQLVNRISLRR